MGIEYLSGKMNDKRKREGRRHGCAADSDAGDRTIDERLLPSATNKRLLRHIFVFTNREVQANFPLL